MPPNKRWQRREGAMYCRQCGSELQASAKFCEACGNAAQSSASGVSLPPTELRPAEPQQAQPSAKWSALSLKFANRDQAVQAIGESAKGFYVVAGIQALASFAIGASG